VFEFANKRNLKAMVRYVLRKQKWSPFDRQPIEFAQLNFDFHPAWMKQQLREVGFSIQRTRAVSTFRAGALKRLFGAKRLATLDGALQRPLAPLSISPSIFTLCSPSPDVRQERPQVPHAFRGSGGGEVVFACPTCRASLPTQPTRDELCCTNGHCWSVREGIYDFKTPL
jgi:hypothetical protein